MSSILVIDDHEDIRQLLRDILERAGYTVREAADGREGVELYLEQPDELVITDLLMPEQSGLETIEQLLKHDAKIPIIAISGAGDSEHEAYFAQALERGAKKTLLKPFSPKVLLSAIEELLKSP